MVYVEEIKTFIVNELLKGKESDSVSEDTDLIDEGILDSLAIMQLIDFLEKKFDIRVEMEEIIPENVGSIQRLSDYIGRKNKD